MNHSVVCATIFVTVSLLAGCTSSDDIEIDNDNDGGGSEPPLYRFGRKRQ